jgi:hypothetical protein
LARLRDTARPDREPRFSPVLFSSAIVNHPRKNEYVCYAPGCQGKFRASKLGDAIVFSPKKHAA